MKNPNGYGAVFKLSGKRRKPWGVRKTTGWSSEGKQFFQNIGYYTTRQEAMIALADFNANPYDIEASTITFAEIFEKFSYEKFSKISQSNVNGYIAAYKLSESLHNMKFVDIKKAHMQSVIDECEKGHGTLRKIKVLFNQMFKYAMENDVVSKDYSKFVELGENESESTKAPFSLAEIQVLWDNVDRMEFVDTILIMIYTGLRPGELVLIETANINLEEGYMRGGLKTKAGKNRVIPIHPKIRQFIEKRMNHKFLIVNHVNEQMTYYNYYQEKWKRMMEQLNLNHYPHECRHTFATLMDNAGANKVAIKRIMGHASKDITDKVYTHKDIEELKKAIELLK